MNTTKKGDEFELRVYRLIKSLVANDDFYVPGKKSEVFQKKKYFSQRRDADIIFDISIETRLAPELPYSTLTLVECKHYNSTVGVEDIEEFESKIRQIGEHNTKGILVTNNNLKKSALSLVRSLGIGLIKMESDDQYEWINYRIDSKKLIFDRQLIEQYFTEPLPVHSGNFVAIFDDKLYSNLSELLIAAKVFDHYWVKDKYLNVPYLSDEKIEAVTKRLLAYDVFERGNVNTQKLCDFLTTVYPISFDLDTLLHQDVLGKIQFDPLRISVTSALKDDTHRLRFTLAHEIGHLILHQKLLSGVSAERTDDEVSIETAVQNSDGDNKRLEIQANIFASMLLLPEVEVRMATKRFFQDNSIYKGHLYVDHQQVNQQLMLSLLDQLSQRFEVSMEMAKVRLIKLGIIKFNAENSVKGIIRQNRIR